MAGERNVKVKGTGEKGPKTASCINSSLFCLDCARFSILSWISLCFSNVYKNELSALLEAIHIPVKGLN